MTIQIFLTNVLRMILCLAFVRKKHDYIDFKEKFVDIFNRHAPKKIKTFWSNQERYTNKTLRKAVMKRSQLKNKANKTWSSIDLSDYKKQRNYVANKNN